MSFFKGNSFFFKHFYKLSTVPVLFGDFSGRIWVTTQSLGPCYKESLNFVNLLPLDFIFMITSLPQTLIATF